MHAERLRRNGSLERKGGDRPGGGWRPGDTPCEVEECPDQTRGGAFGFCRKHATRFRKYGDPRTVRTRTGLAPGTSPGFLNKSLRHGAIDGKAIAR